MPPWAGFLLLLLPAHTSQPVPAYMVCEQPDLRVLQSLGTALYLLYKAFLQF